MSRNERRRGGRNRNYRENSEKSDQRKQELRTAERSERKHESRGSGSYERRQERRRSMSLQNQKIFEENQNAIKAYKEYHVVCDICGEEISDIASAIKNKVSKKPVHFDCVLSKLAESEKIGLNEKIAYIGQGKFAVLHFQNPHDQKHFSIQKTIEWETREEERGEWRNEIAGLFSQVK